MGINIIDGDDDWLTPAEEASEFDVTEATLAAWRSWGRGPKYFKDGRVIRYSKRLNAEYRASKIVTPESAKVRRQQRALSKQNEPRSPP